MEISASMVKDLREKTGAGMMECKKALTECGGDLEKSIVYLRERGMAAAQKKSGRAAKDGLVFALAGEDGKTGALVEVNCETDFVAKTDDFKGLINAIAKTVLASKGAETVEALLNEQAAGGTGKVSDLLTQTIAKLGENMQLRRFARFETAGLLSSYIHAGGKVGVMVEMEAAASDDVKALAKDMAMQVAAAKPQFVSRQDVPADVLGKEKEIYMTQARNSGKPEKILEKIVEGKVEKFYEEICLVDQPFIREQSVKIRTLLADAAKKAGSTVAVKRFARFQVGEE